MVGIYWIKPSGVLLMQAQHAPRQRCQMLSTQSFRSQNMQPVCVMSRVIESSQRHLET